MNISSKIGSYTISFIMLIDRLFKGIIWINSARSPSVPSSEIAEPKIILKCFSFRLVVCGKRF